MTATARRRFLTGLTAAVAAPVAIAAPAAAVAAVPAMVTRAVTELPGLLAIGRQLLEAEIEFDAAAAAKEAAQFEFKKLRPPLPPALIAGFYESHEVSVPRRNAFGDPVWREDGCGLVRVFEADLLEEYVVRHGIDGRTKRGRLCRQLIALARKHEAAEADAKRQTGLDVCTETLNDVIIRVQNLSEEAVCIEPRTSLGVAILASAYLIGRKIATHEGYHSSRLDLIGAHLANEVRIRNVADLRNLLRRADS